MQYDNAFLYSQYINNNNNTTNNNNYSNSIFVIYKLLTTLVKILERLVKEQLIAHLTKHFPLHNAQHGFIMGRSTVTNSAACDLLIADCVSLGHPYDIITIDLQKAFDKIPHSSIIEALSCRGITGSALAWYASFLSNNSAGAHWRQNIREGLSFPD